MAIGIASIVVICASCFGGIVSLATMFHQLLYSRNNQINAAIQKRALEQQQQALSQIRNELRQERTPIDSFLYDDSKHILDAIEQRMDHIYEQKAELLEKHMNLLDKYLNQTRVDNEKSQLSPPLSDLNNDFKLQLDNWDARLKSIQEERSQILNHQFELVKGLQKTEEVRTQKLNELYETHSQMIDKMQHAYSEQQLSLSELFMKSSLSLMESIVVAPARFMASYFSTNSSGDNTRMEKEIKQRGDTILLEKQLNTAVEYIPAQAFNIT